MRKSQYNNNDFNHHDFSDPENSINQHTTKNKQSKDMIDSIEYEKLIKKNIDYKNLKNMHYIDNKIVDEIIKIMTDTVCTQKTTVRINGENIPSEIVKSRFLKITNEHIEYICDCLNKNTTQITNIRAYLLTVLYNSTATIDNYYKSTVNHDLYGSDF